MASGKLHPVRIVTGAAGSAWLGPAKRFVVKRLYVHLARRYPLPDWTCMNYGFAPVGDAPVPPGDPERYGLSLYWRVATAGRRGADWSGLDAVEVGSGRGGGAAFLARALHPRRLTGVDIAPPATALAARRYADVANLAFVTGDAEALDLPDASADVALNVESAHGYAHVPRFLAEVARVLRPGGELLFAGFAARPGGAYDRLVEALSTSPLRLERLDDITPGVVASLAADEARKRAWLEANATGWLKSFALGAYAMEGSPMRRGLDRGETAYVAAVLSKG